MPPDETQGGAPPNGTQGAGAPSGVTEEKVAEIVNRAISARNKLFEQQVGKQLDGALKEIKESMSTLAKTVSEAGGDGEGKKKKKDAEPDDNSIKVLQRQIADLQAENERTKATEKATRMKARDQALRTKVAEALSEVGIKDPAAVRRAMLHLVDGERRIAYRDDDDDTIGFRDPSDDTVLDLPTGLKAWAKTDDGKFFLPPTGARGSGDGRGGTAPGQNGQPDQSALWNGLAEKLFSG